MQLFPAAEMLEQGISPKDAPKFLDTDSGMQYTKDSVVLVKLMPQEVLWIPYGWLASPLVLDKKEDKAEEKSEQSEHRQEEKDDKNEQLGFVMHVPYFSDTMAKALSEPVRKAVLQWSSDHLTNMKSQRLWAGRHETFTKFLKSL